MCDTVHISDTVRTCDTVCICNTAHTCNTFCICNTVCIYHYRLKTAAAPAIKETDVERIPSVSNKKETFPMETSSAKHIASISIRDLFLYLLSKWRLFLICFAVGALILGAYGAYKNLSSSGNEENDAKVIEDITGEMSDLEIADCNASAASIASNLALYDSYKEYIDKSVYQSLLPEGLKNSQLTYFVSYEENKYTQKDTSVSSAIAYAYASRIFGESFDEEISEEFGISAEDSFYYYDGVVSIDWGATDQGIVVISIYGNDEDFLQDMTSLVKRHIEGLKEDVAALLGTHTVTLISEQIGVINSSEILKNQQTYIKNMQSAVGSIEKSVDDLDGASLEYVKYLVESEYSGENIAIAFADAKATEDADTGDADDTVSLKAMINKKYILAGALAGLIVCAVVMIIRYLTQGMLRCYDDMEYCYGIQVLGSFDAENVKRHHTSLDRLIRIKRIKRGEADRSVRAELTAERLRLAAEKKGIKDICIAIGAGAISGPDFVQDIAMLCGELNIVAAYDIKRNPKALESMRQSQGAVLLEQTDRSKLQDIEEEWQICAANDIPVLGAIVAE